MGRRPGLSWQPFAVGFIAGGLGGGLAGHLGAPLWLVIVSSVVLGLAIAAGMTKIGGS